MIYHMHSTNSMLWHPYFGAFVLHLIFETTTCFISGFSIPSKEGGPEFVSIISFIRAFSSLLLLLDAFDILITRRAKRSEDEECQSLLTKRTQAHSTTAEPATTTYGAMSVNDPEGEEAGHSDNDNQHDAEMKAKQAKRLEDEGGWVGYLKAFSIFLPYLFPKDDWKVMGALVVRMICMLQKRALNLLTPRELGVITNKLSEPDPTMPWKDIGLWVFYSYINSSAGLGSLDNIAKLVITNSAYRSITLLAYKHVLGLSTDFHTSKDSGEVLKAVEQASSLNSLIETVFFDVCPILLDLIVSMYYVTSLFDAYMAFIILFTGAAYINIGWFSTSLSQPKRRDYVEKQRMEGSTANETVHNWETVVYFNRLSFEYARYATNISNTISAQYAYDFRSMGGYATQTLATTFGFAGCCVFGMTQIVSGRKHVGDFVTLIMY
jgi:hypothetical protein